MWLPLRRQLLLTAHILTGAPLALIVFAPAPPAPVLANGAGMQITDIDGLPETGSADLMRYRC